MTGIMIRNYTCFWNRILKHIKETPGRNQHRICFYSDQAKPDKDEEPDVPSYAYRDESAEYATGKKYAILKLQQLLGLRPFAATEIASKFKKLQMTTGKTMSDNYEILKKEGIGDDLILKYPEVLSQKELQIKITLVKELAYQLRETLPLLNLTMQQLQRFLGGRSYAETYSIRIQCFSNLFEMPVIDVCDCLVKRPFLNSIGLSKAEANCKILMDFGIQVAEIKSDYWVLQYNTEVIHQRLTAAKQVKLDKLKTWMVRAQQGIFNNYIQRRSENKQILGEHSIADYLSERLECSAETSTVILAKHPALTKKSVKKLKEIIDFLYADGYNPIQIVRSPKILLHSVETTKKRLRELESTGMKVDSFHILTKSQKQYMHYYSNLVKNIKTKSKEQL